MDDMSWITGSGEGDNTATSGGGDVFSIQELFQRVQTLEDQVTPYAPFLPLLAELLERCSKLEDQLKKTQKELITIKTELGSARRAAAVRTSSIDQDVQKDPGNSSDECDSDNDIEMKPYICKLCNGSDQMVMIFQDADGLAQHYITQHPHSADPVLTLTEQQEKSSSPELHELQSQVGPNSESIATTAKRIIISQSNESLIPGARSVAHKCLECNVTFIHASHLSRHRMSVHSAPTLSCEFCEKPFHRRDKLREHQMRLHNRVSESLATPMRTPMSKGKFPCPDGCGRGFQDRWKAQQHLNSCRGFKPYMCDSCGNSFQQERSLRKHKKKMHPDDLNELKTPERVICSNCGMSVLGRKMIQHMRTHSGLKTQHQCGSCGANFRTRDDLRTHKRTHTGPFVCGECDGGFEKISSLNAHQQSHRRRMGSVKGDPQIRESTPSSSSDED